MKRSRIAPRSDTKAEWHRRYMAEKRLRLQTVKHCQYTGNRVPLDGHHPFGQAGKNILIFVLVGREAHDFFHAHPRTARDLGWICDGLRSDTPNAAVLAAMKRATELISNG